MSAQACKRRRKQMRLGKRDKRFFATKFRATPASKAPMKKAGK